MNKHDHEREKMLAEAFHGDWSARASAKFAAGAASAARRSQRARRVLFTVSAAAGIAAVLLVSLHRQSGPQSVIAVVPHRAAGYEIISDAELLSQIVDRPILVIRQQGNAPEFMLLEEQLVAPEAEASGD